MLNLEDTYLEGNEEQYNERLPKDHSLTILNFAFKQIGDMDVKEIVETLKMNQSFTTLNLKCNEISGEGVREIAEALKTNQSLITLYLGYNLISDEGARAIVDALEDNWTLQELTLFPCSINKLTIERTTIERINSYLTRNKEAFNKKRFAHMKVTSEIIGDSVKEELPKLSLSPSLFVGKQKIRQTEETTEKKIYHLENRLCIFQHSKQQ